MSANHFSGKKLFWLATALLLALASTSAVLAGAGALAGRAAALKVGLVTDSPQVMDGGFNQMAYAGLLRAQVELGVEGTVYTSTDFAEIEANLAQCASEANELCFAVGFMASEAISASARLYTGTQFAILDVAFTDYPDNLQGMAFASEEAAYLAGTLAGKMTESGVLGLIGGMHIPPVTVFLDGYAQGAACANPEVTTVISITNNFMDPELGAQYARAMLDRGADVIFAAAGPTGNGAILTTTQSGGWAVGVDADQYLTLFANGAAPGAERLLTSAMKRMDNAVYQVISDSLSAAFTPGTVVYDLANSGVDLAPYHEAEAAIPAEAKAAVELARSRLIAGEIDPYGPCPEDTYFLYLPMVVHAYPPPPPRWSSYASPVAADLQALDFSSPSDGWAVGAGGAILHWDGSAWSTFSSPTGSDLKGVHLLEAGSGWAVGSGGVILNWNGAQWSAAASPVGVNLNDVHSLAANDAWAVGDDGTLLHWDGAAWSAVASPTTYDLFAVDFLSGADGWAVGGAWNSGIGWYEAVYLHWNGSAWSSYTPVHVLDPLYDVDLVSGTYAVAVGLNNAKSFWDGASWDSSYSVPNMTQYNGVDFLSETDGWAVGWMYQESNIQHWDGSGWSRAASPVTSGLNAVHILEAENGWAVGEAGVILRYGR